MVYLEDLKLHQLKSFAKSLKLTGYRKLRKKDLIVLIRNHSKKKIYLEDLKLHQLKSFAKNLKLTRYSRLRKNDLIVFIRNHFDKTIRQNKQKKHKKKFLRREERKKDKKEFKRIEAEKREKIKTEKEQKKEERAEERREKKRKNKEKKKQKKKEKEQKDLSQVKEFREKVEEKKKALRKLKEKELVETDSALKNFARQFTVDGEPGFDPKSFFNATKQSLLKILRENRGVKAKIILNCLMKRIDLKTGEETKVEATFHSEVKTNLLGTNEKKLLNVMFEEVLENMARFQRRGSNWKFEEVLKLEIHLVGFVPLKGNSWIPLPETISKKKAVINMKNEDNECFKWCVTRALNPVEHHPERITQDLRRQSEELNWRGIEFPMKIDQIDKFERMNERISVNVFYYDKGVLPLRVPKVEKEYQIDLLLITSEKDVEENERGKETEKKHYCLIKNLSRLLSSQVTKQRKALVFCRRCLNHFPNEERLNTHKEFCSQKDNVKIVMPKEGAEDIQFKNLIRMMKLPIVVYADFEAFLENIDSCEPNSKSSFTEKYQMHKLCGFCFKIVFSEDIEKKSSLASLTKNLAVNPEKLIHTRSTFREKTVLVSRKGVYPYDWMNSFEKFSERQLPSKDKFFDKLNGSNVSEADYNHAQNVWKEFGMKNMGEYHDLYLKTDVLLLADVFEEFRSVCLENYDLDPAWYYTSPGLAWHTALNKTGVRLELLTDPDMLLMFEEGIRGGVSMITTRYGKANNPYMGEDFNRNKPTTYLPYLDANNLYGWGMCKPLPVSCFEWMNDEELENWREIPNILEVDLEYPKELHEEHNDYPLAPERLIIDGTEKLIPNLRDKEKYVVHHEIMKLYLQLGLKIKKIHRGIKFREKSWLKPYIEMNTELRKKGKNDFEKDFFKLMNKSVFGKTMENIRNRADIRLINDRKLAEKFAAKPNFKHLKIFNENLVSIHMKRTKLYFNKPIYCGMAILDLSKLLMYDFHYNYMKKKFKRMKLLFTDTDSLCYELETDDFFKDISADVENKFDTSNFEKDHKSGIFYAKNKKVIGMMKDEAGGKIIEEFVGLRAKLYSYKMHSGGSTRKCKGIKKAVIKNEITHEDYKNCLFGRKSAFRKMNVIRSHSHNIYTEKINKVALSGDDDKRIILEDGIHTLALGHFKIEE